MTPRKRFYKSVSVTGDYGIALDGRVVKTPLKSPLRLPTQELAEAVAAEWAAQGEKIAPSTMLFTKLANTAIDRVAMDRSRIVNEILEYAGSDLVSMEGLRYYESEMEAGKKTISFRLTVGAADRTMSSAEVEVIRDRIIAGMRSRGFELRV